MICSSTLAFPGLEVIGLVLSKTMAPVMIKNIIHYKTGAQEKKRPMLYLDVTIFITGVKSI